MLATLVLLEILPDCSLVEKEITNCNLIMKALQSRLKVVLLQCVFFTFFIFNFIDLSKTSLSYFFDDFVLTNFLDFEFGVGLIQESSPKLMYLTIVLSYDSAKKLVASHTISFIIERDAVGIFGAEGFGFYLIS